MYGYGFYNSFKPSVGAVAFDPDAQAFITAASITDPTQQGAVNQLVLDLKSASIWTKMGRIYPMIGGSATAHRIDLKTLSVGTFYGGWTHSSTGSLPNGSNAYFDTGFTMSGGQTLTSHHFSLYSRTNIASLTDFGSSGVRNQITALGFALCLRRKGDNWRYTVAPSEATGGVVLGGAETDSRGFYIGSRTANNFIFFQKNSTTIATNTSTNTDTTLSTNSFYIAGINQLGSPLAAAYDNKEIAFSTIGLGLSEAESDILYTAIQNYQTTLNRQV